MKNTFSQIFNRWIRYDRRIVLPKAVYQNIILSSRNMNFPFSDHRIFYRKFPRNFPKFSRKFPGKFLTPPSTPRTYPPYHSLTPNPQNPEPTQNLKSNFLKCTFLVGLCLFFPPDSYIIRKIQHSYSTCSTTVLYCCSTVVTTTVL